LQGKIPGGVGGKERYEDRPIGGGKKEGPEKKGDKPYKNVISRKTHQVLGPVRYKSI